MRRISHCCAKDSRGGEESLGGNYKIGAAIVGKETFLGGLMLSVLVSWRAGCVETMGVKCWGCNTVSGA